MKIASVVVTLGFLALGGPFATGDASDISLQANLDGFGQVPPVITTGMGSFKARINTNGTITYTLTYSQLAGTGEVNFADIHFGQKQNTGGIIFFLCANQVTEGGITVPPGTPQCHNGAGTSTVTRTIGAESVVGPVAQGINANDLAAALKAIRSGLTYAQVHTVQFTGGEIRGQINQED